MSGTTRCPACLDCPLWRRQPPRYSFDLEMPGLAEREDAWQRRLDQAWTVGEMEELMAREGEDAQGGGD